MKTGQLEEMIRDEIIKFKQVTKQELRIMF